MAGRYVLRAHDVGSVSAAVKQASVPTGEGAAFGEEDRNEGQNVLGQAMRSSRSGPY